MNYKSVAIQVAISILLIITLVVEVRTAFSIMGHRSASLVQASGDAASNFGKAQVSIEEIYDYDEVPFEDGPNHDVFAISMDLQTRVKVDGVVNDSSYSDYGYYYYTANDSGQSETLAVNKISEDIDGFHTALTDYWFGKTEGILPFMNLEGTDESMLEFYQCKSTDNRYPVIHNSVSDLYLMVVDKDTYYYLISTRLPFQITNDRMTAHFTDPSEDPMVEHSYTPYETLAAENTIRELNEKDEEEDMYNPYITEAEIVDENGEVGSSDTYTSKMDIQKRNRLASLADLKFGYDGVSADSSVHLDITSSNAKAAQWYFRSDRGFMYLANGLRISGLTATATNRNFELSGNVNNTINYERPYVLVIKYLNSNNSLIGIKVVDNRENPLDALGVGSFNVTVTGEEMSVADIHSLMFEIY